MEMGSWHLGQRLSSVIMFPLDPGIFSDESMRDLFKQICDPKNELTKCLSFRIFIDSTKDILFNYYLL